MKPYVVLISLVAACGGLLFGFDTAVISGVVPFIKPYFNLSDAELGLAVSSVLLGCIAGTQLAGKPGDLLGRKKTLLITALLFLISALGSAMAESFAGFIVYRIIGGIAVGAASVLSPVYIAEIAPPKSRGRLVSINQLTIVIGILLAFFSNYFLIGVGEDNWRWMLGVMAFPAVVFFLLMLLVPESPRWLYMKGKKEQSLKVLKTLLSDDELPAEVIRIEGSIYTSDRSAGIKDIFFQKKLRWLVMLGIILAMLQQFTGINIIMYYAPLIFEKSGTGVSSALLQTIAIGVINLVFTILSMSIIDRVGRKPLLIFGQLFMGAFLLILSVTFFLNKMEGNLAIFFILGFIAAFAISSGPVTWVLISEIYPNHIRGTAVSVATFFLWVAAFIVSYSFPVMLQVWGGGYTFLFYGFINLAGFVFVKLSISETKGKSLEELGSYAIKSSVDNEG
jgi:SP family arabinose:H+ symporter-like MFS transporter